ncbi:uncharacterized protein si:ch211-227n13.3 isoform X2 [Dicentrarchus labrax]|uniref:uncharacterized protein si:ch211-227n13.3 isoform X2 n=1 Tax=Dicentrarchus labrax TaxID=13489 RepID=UPI0021F62F44|nr:uncharacterized protein si:ch211-227n13.3 isoform X2 [Dicentrarchus labrax]
MFKPVTDSGCEADGLEMFIHATSSIRVEYYRSFEYCVKWERSMSPRRSSRLTKASKKSPQRSPSPNEEVTQGRLGSKRQRIGLRKTKASDSAGSDRDIIDIINSTDDAKHVKEDEGQFVEVADEGVDESDEESVTSSIASGPSLRHNDTPKTLRPSQGVCSACRKLYQKTKKIKTPIKNKLLDNDPKSLTCDQWVLIKDWRPRRLPNARGKLLTHVQLVKKRLKNGAKRTEQCVGERESSACSRPHTFLQRNLRRRVRVPLKRGRRKNRRKRTQDDSQGPRVAKQQRLHSNNRRQHSSIGCTDNDPTIGHSSSAGLEGWSDQEMDSPEETDLTIELIPSIVTMETTKPRNVPTKQKEQKKTCGFRDLLSQLRGNSSMIVRETR